MNETHSRRSAIQMMSSGLGGIALASMAGGRAGAEIANPLASTPTHFPARAKHIIYLSMRGGPSHVDTFDYKPKLQKDSGKVGRYGGSKLLGSQWDFQQRGESGLWISDLFPHIAKHADDLCLLRGMHCDTPTHIPAVTQTHTGSINFVRPSMGAWSLYGLGTDNTNLPGFVVLGAERGKKDYTSAFLPAYYQGTLIGGGGRAVSVGPPEVPNIRNQQMGARSQRAQLDFVQWLNQDKLKRVQQSAQVEGMIQSMELGFRMQSTMPELLDYTAETPQTLEAYGIKSGGATEKLGKNCLLARRMIESGVRFVEVVHGGWDHHQKLKSEMERSCGETDQPIAALLQDLKQRDLLKDTLVIWGGEFGRTPDSQGNDGRGHNNKGYTTWMAGGGVKGGFSYGETDDYGYEAVADKMHIHDWHATIMHLMGLDHEKLTYRYAGRDFRLTDVHGRVAKEILA